MKEILNNIINYIEKLIYGVDPKIKKEVDLNKLAAELYQRFNQKSIYFSTLIYYRNFIYFKGPPVGRRTKFVLGKLNRLFLFKNKIIGIVDLSSRDDTPDLRAVVYRNGTWKQKGYNINNILNDKRFKEIK